jgi:hypothetical protein
MNTDSHLFFNTQFNRLLKIFFVTYITVLLAYSLLNWLLSTKTSIKVVDEKYLDFWIPWILCLGLSFWLFKSILIKLEWNKELITFLIYGLLPICMVIPIDTSQKYLKEFSQKLITIDNLSETELFQKGIFFKINKFIVDSSNFSLLRIKQQIKNDLLLSNYYVIPIRDSNNELIKKANVVYGVMFRTWIHHGKFEKELPWDKIELFNDKSNKEFENYEFSQVDYFEKIENTTDASYFKEAWSHHTLSNNNYETVFLIKKNGPLLNRFNEDKVYFLTASLSILGITILLLCIFNYIKICELRLK